MSWSPYSRDSLQYTYQFTEDVPMHGYTPIAIPLITVLPLTVLNPVIYVGDQFHGHNFGAFI